MRAISQDIFGGPEVLKVVELDRPTPGPTEVLIRAKAIAVNPADWKISSGAAPLFGEPPLVLGFDLSGEVVEVGKDVTRFQVGDQVYGMPTMPASAYAEYVTAPAKDLAPVPANLDHIQAGALAAVALTAWQALTKTAQISAGQRILINAASGGVGHIAIQIAKAHGAYVVATGQADRHEFLKKLGADEVIDYTKVNVSEAVTDMDIVFDLLGGKQGPEALKSLRRGGILLSALWDQPGVDSAEAAQQGFRHELVQVAPSGSDLVEINKLVEAGKLTVHIDQVFPLADVAQAHKLSMGGRVKGKLVLQP